MYAVFYMFSEAIISQYMLHVVGSVFFGNEYKTRQGNFL